jgi:hypothetical protein
MVNPHPIDSVNITHYAVDIHRLARISVTTLFSSLDVSHWFESSEGSGMKQGENPNGTAEKASSPWRDVRRVIGTMSMANKSLVRTPEQ